jgi:ribosomal protein S18 acetylase RimI-like enzyme
VVPQDNLESVEIEVVIRNMRVFPFEHLFRHVGIDPISKFIASSIINSKSSSTALEGRIDGSLYGITKIEHLAFDSNFFHAKMGRIDPVLISDDINVIERRKLCHAILSKAISIAREEGFKQITMRVSPRDIDVIQVACSLGFNFIDAIVTYAIDTDYIDANKIQPPKDLTIRMKKLSDFEEIKKIARDSFLKDRFHSDTRFDRQSADDFHEKWVENSLLGKVADEVIVAEVDGVPVGFTTIRRNKEISRKIGLQSGSMILSAVDRKQRGKSIYKHMIAGGLKWFKSSVDVVDLGTQVDNLPVQRAWCGLGFKPVMYMVTLHWWDELT